MADSGIPVLQALASLFYPGAASYSPPTPVSTPVASPMAPAALGMMRYGADFMQGGYVPPSAQTGSVSPQAVQDLLSRLGQPSGGLSIPPPQLATPAATPAPVSTPASASIPGGGGTIEQIYQRLLPVVLARQAAGQRSQQQAAAPMQPQQQPGGLIPPMIPQLLQMQRNQPQAQIPQALIPLIQQVMQMRQPQRAAGPGQSGGRAPMTPDEREKLYANIRKDGALEYLIKIEAQIGVNGWPQKLVDPDKYTTPADRENSTKTFALRSQSVKNIGAAGIPIEQWMFPYIQTGVPSKPDTTLERGQLSQQFMTDRQLRQAAIDGKGTLVRFDLKTGEPDLRGKVYPSSAIVIPSPDGSYGLVVGKPDETWWQQYFHWGVTDDPPVIGPAALPPPTGGAPGLLSGKSSKTGTPFQQVQ